MESDFVVKAVGEAINRRAREISNELANEFVTLFRARLITVGTEIADALNRQIQLRQQVMADRIELVLVIPTTNPQPE